MGSSEETRFAMKVAYIIPRFGTAFSANEIHVQLCQALRELGADVTVMAFAVEGDTGGLSTVELADGGTTPGFLARAVATQLTGYSRLIELVAPLRRALVLHRPDVVHLEGAFPAGVTHWLAFPRNPLPSVVSLQGTDVIRRPDLGFNRLEKVAVRWLLVRSLRSASVIRANSPATAHILQALVAHPRIHIVPRNVALRYLRYTLEEAMDLHLTARHKLEAHLPIGSEPLVAAFGRLHPCKGFEQLLEASARLQNLGLQHKLLIAGPDSPEIQRQGNYRERLRQVANRLGISPSTLLLGPVSEADMLTHYAASDVVVVPSLLEGFNKVAIEAAALARPVVISDGAGAHTYFREHGAGIVVPAGDVSTLTKAIAEVLTSPSEAKAMAERAHRMAHLFTPQRVAEALMGAFNSAVQ